MDVEVAETVIAIAVVLRHCNRQSSAACPSSERKRNSAWPRILDQTNVSTW